VFLTNRSELQGTFPSGDDALLFWNRIRLDRSRYSFLIEGVGLDEDGIGPIARFFSDIALVQRVCNGESSDFLQVNKIHLLAPPVLTEKPSFVLEPLSEIRLISDCEQRPKFEFVTDSGEVYLSEVPAVKSSVGDEVA